MWYYKGQHAATNEETLNEDDQGPSILLLTIEKKRNFELEFKANVQSKR